MKNRSYAVPVVLVMLLALLLLVALGCSKTQQTTTQQPTATSEVRSQNNVMLVDMGEEQLISAKIGPSDRGDDFRHLEFQDPDARRFLTACVGVYDKDKGTATVHLVWGLSNADNPKSLELGTGCKPFQVTSENVIEQCRQRVPDETTETWQGRGRVGKLRVASLSEAATCLKAAGEFGVIVRGTHPDRFHLESQRFIHNRATTDQWPSVMVIAGSGERILRVTENLSASFFTHATGIELASWAGVINVIDLDSPDRSGFYGYMPRPDELSSYDSGFESWLKSGFISKPLGYDGDWKPNFSHFKRNEGVTVTLDGKRTSVEGNYISSTEWAREAAINGATLTFAVRVHDKGEIVRESQVHVLVRGQTIPGKVIAITENSSDGVVLTIKPSR